MDTNVKITAPSKLLSQYSEYWLSPATITLALIFLAAFLAINFHVSQLQDDLNHAAALETAANLSGAVEAFRSL